MRVEMRAFPVPDHEDKRMKRRVLVLISENEAESKMIDAVLGDKDFDEDGKGPACAGNVCLSDGYGEHYIRLEKKFD